MRAATATDICEFQHEYAVAVDRWCDFRNLLEEKNPNRIQPKLHGTMLWAQLGGRARDCIRKIPRSNLTPENVAKAGCTLFCLRAHCNAITT